MSAVLPPLLILIINGSIYKVLISLLLLVFLLLGRDHRELVQRVHVVIMRLAIVELHPDVPL